jgi:tRNA A37 methylthiotransferase MiaB
VGTEVTVLVDGPAEEGGPAPLVARTAKQADDVDGCTYLRPRAAAPAPGSFVRARVVESLDYDLVAETIA